MKLKNSNIDKRIEEGDISLLDGFKLVKRLLKENNLNEKEKEISNWINNEINGYSDDSVVPGYRKITCKIFGKVKALGYLPGEYEVIDLLKEEQKEKYTNISVRDSLSFI